MLGCFAEALFTLAGATALALVMADVAPGVVSMAGVLLLLVGAIIRMNRIERNTRDAQNPTRKGDG
jgi:hypothetical protein